MIELLPEHCSEDEPAEAAALALSLWLSSDLSSSRAASLNQAALHELLLGAGLYREVGSGSQRVHAEHLLGRELWLFAIFFTDKAIKLSLLALAWLAK